MLSPVIEMLLDGFFDALKDTLTLIPFLYITYVVMEWLELKASSWTQRAIARAGKAGPLVGSLAGAIPQCGFSAMGATLYAARVITLGTLIAVFLSTSDEMLPVFVANAAPLSTILSIIAFKVVAGMLFGFLIDFILRRRHPQQQAARICEMCEHDHCGCEHNHDNENLSQAACMCSSDQVSQHAVDSCCDNGGAALDGTTPPHHKHTHAHTHAHTHGSIWLAALKHTLQVTLYIFIVTLVLSIVMDSVGSDVIASFFMRHPESSIFISGLVGLIPNCAASVVISELYLEGVIGAGAMIGGLLIGAGIGLLVLFRSNRPLRENFAIVFLLYVIGVGVALLVNACGLVF